MSRVGKMPVTVPQGVDVAIKDDQITVKGSNGAFTNAVVLTFDPNQPDELFEIEVKAVDDDEHSGCA